jgi:hypothetical protein
MRRAVAGLLLIVACSGEQPAPETTTETQQSPVPAVPSTAKLTPSPATPQPVTTGTYQQAMDWLRATRGFHFEVEESGVRAVGDMARPMIGAERVRFQADGVEWLATAKATGIHWYKRSGPKWIRAEPPVYAHRIYERVTVVFDPQKKEGAPQLSGGDAATNLYRFTNANTGEVHELWVARRDGHIERMKIGNAVEIRFTDPAGDVPNV